MEFASELEREMNNSDEFIPKGLQSIPITPSHDYLGEALKLTNKASLQGSSQLKLYVQRSKVWKQVVSEMQDSLIETPRISVKFIGEAGVDTGGLTREMLSLSFQQVALSGITRGEAPNLTFMHDQQALKNHHYKVLGQLVALSLLNCGSGPHFFCPILASYIVGADYQPRPSELLVQLPKENNELKEKLESLVACEDEDTWNEGIANFQERFDMGINSASIPIEKKQELVMGVVKHTMISSVAEEIFSFTEGLSLFGVLDLLKQYPESAAEELTYCGITANKILNAFCPSFSEKGSNRREQEETIMFNLNQFLKKCERGSVTKTVIDIEALERDGVVSEVTHTLGLSDVFQFLSGSRFLPTWGMEVEIEFLHGVPRGQRVKANTCGVIFSIPVNQRYTSDDSNVFTSNFGDDIFDSPGYGCV